MAESKSIVRSFSFERVVAAGFAAWCDEKQLKYSAALNALLKVFLREPDIQQQVYKLTPEGQLRIRGQERELHRQLAAMWHNPATREAAEKRYRELGWKNPEEIQRSTDEWVKILVERHER
jgi:hypothetical protein